MPGVLKDNWRDGVEERAAVGLGSARTKRALDSIQQQNPGTARAECTQLGNEKGSGTPNPNLAQ